MAASTGQVRAAEVRSTGFSCTRHEITIPELDAASDDTGRRAASGVFVIHGALAASNPSDFAAATPAQIESGRHAVATDLVHGRHAAAGLNAAIDARLEERDAIPGRLSPGSLPLPTRT
ncbi:hypothetical protein [Lichenicola sp.]|uniref:hypothetical protein n=1 Tax=Lichenicola sp. TaxID=2804529 RepID=UPI003AFF9B95